MTPPVSSPIISNNHDSSNHDSSNHDNYNANESSLSPSSLLAKVATFADIFAPSGYETAIVHLAVWSLLSESSPLYFALGLGLSPAKMLAVTVPNPPNATPSLPQEVIDNIDQINQFLPMEGLPPIDIEHLGLPEAYIANISTGQLITAVIWAYATVKGFTKITSSIISACLQKCYSSPWAQNSKEPAHFLSQHILSYIKMAYVSYRVAAAFDLSAVPYRENLDNITQWTNSYIQDKGVVCDYRFPSAWLLKLYFLFANTEACDPTSLRLMLSAPIIPYNDVTLAFIQATLMMDAVSGASTMLIGLLQCHRKWSKTLNDKAQKLLGWFGKEAPSAEQQRRPLTHQVALLDEKMTTIAAGETSWNAKGLLRKVAHVLKSMQIGVFAGLSLPAMCSFITLLTRKLPTDALNTCNNYEQLMFKDLCKGRVNASQGDAYLSLQSTISNSSSMCTKTLQAHNIPGFTLPPFVYSVPCQQTATSAFTSPLDVVNNEVGMIYETFYYYLCASLIAGATWGICTPPGNNNEGMTKVANTLFVSTLIGLSLQQLPIIISYIERLFVNIPKGSALVGNEVSGYDFLSGYLEELWNICWTPEENLIQAQHQHGNSTAGNTHIVNQAMAQLLTWTDMIYVLTGLMAFLPLALSVLSCIQCGSRKKAQPTTDHDDGANMTDTERGVLVIQGTPESERSEMTGSNRTLESPLLPGASGSPDTWQCTIS